MSTTFVVENGSVVTDANALVSVADADQIIENYGNSSDWSSATTAQKQNAIRQATRYLNFNYTWDGYKVNANQTCQWPRLETYDEDGWLIASDVIPERVKEACAYLSLQVIEGDTLLEDFDDESKVKKTKDVIGPLTEEREYLYGESPEKTYSVVEKLITPFIKNGESFNVTDLERG